MDIRNNKGYLTVSEQIRSELMSPITIVPEEVAQAVVDTAASMDAHGSVVAADPNEGLPHERASSLREFALAEARHGIYRTILTELVFRGEVDASALDTLKL